MMTVLKTSLAGIEFITKWEGSKSSIYLDVAGLPTIGVGHLLTKKERETGLIFTARGPVNIEKKITLVEIKNILESDLRFVEDKLNSILPPVTQPQFDALVSLAFNIGTGAFSKSTLKRKLVDGDFAGAAVQFLRWNKVAGEVVKGLDRRRKAEYKLFVEGVYG